MSSGGSPFDAAPFGSAHSRAELLAPVSACQNAANSAHSLHQAAGQSDSGDEARTPASGLRDSGKAESDGATWRLTEEPKPKETARWTKPLTGNARAVEHHLT
jgi:hypothetical protein